MADVPAVVRIGLDIEVKLIGQGVVLVRIVVVRVGLTQESGASCGEVAVEGIVIIGWLV